MRDLLRPASHLAAVALLLALGACTRAPEPSASGSAPAAPSAQADAAPAGAPVPGADSRNVDPAAAPAAVDAPRWAVSLAAPGEVRPGVAAPARLSIRGKDGFHVNADYPASFRPADAALFPGGARIALAERMVREPCPDDPAHACAAEAEVPFVAPSPGPVRLAGTLAFSVCSEELCLIEKVVLAAETRAR